MALLVPLVLGGVEIAREAADTHYVDTVARRVVHDAGAVTPREKVIALRNYIRANISFYQAPFKDRPFLRAAAGETLRHGKGFCGEVTRTFICMVASVGVHAERVNLYGSQPHVVAEAELAPGNRVIVDCQNPPHIASLEPLDKVMLRPEYQDYSTLNVRRLHLSWLVSRLKLNIGPLTYWLENPHALKAFFWFLLPVLLVASIGMNRLVRLVLRRAGWVHSTDLPVLQAVPVAQASLGEPATRLEPYATRVGTAD